MRASPDHSREPAALLLRSEARVDSAPDFHADAWFVPQAELLQRLRDKGAATG